MIKHNPKNERIKRQYLIYLREAKRQSESSLDAAASAIFRFETYTRFRDFKNFHRQQAVGFKHQLADRDSEVTGATLSQATQYTTLAHIKRFFQWLAGQPGYKSSISYSDADYFNLPAKESRIATARRQRPVPTLEQIKHAISAMPHSTELKCRNRALVAFVLLTGSRDSAVASFKLKHIDLVAGSLFQDAREVKTKNSKTFTTYFFPVGDEIRQIVADWVRYLREERLWGNDDPLFPKTKVQVNDKNRFESSGIDRDHWSNATPIREIFRQAFESAGLHYFNPHSFRSTLTTLGERVCKSPEEFKAWSQNLGHEQVLTTFCSYGPVAVPRQGEIFDRLSKASVSVPGTTSDSADTLAKLLRQNPEIAAALAAMSAVGEDD